MSIDVGCLECSSVVIIEVMKTVRANIDEAHAIRVAFGG